MFRCKTGFSSILTNSSCIPNVLRCDAIVHCDDGSDEQGCDVPCTSDQVQTSRCRLSHLLVNLVGACNFSAMLICYCRFSVRVIVLYGIGTTPV